MTPGEAIIDHLMGLSGFDAWWEGIDEETKDEIVKDLDAMVIDEADAAVDRFGAYLIHKIINEHPE